MCVLDVSVSDDFKISNLQTGVYFSNLQFFNPSPIMKNKLKSFIFKNLTSHVNAPPLISRGFFVKFKLNTFTFFSSVYNFYLANRKCIKNERLMASCNLG